jgi:hypothetical protein
MVQVEHDGSVVHVDVRIHDEPHAFLCLDCGDRWVAEYEYREYRGPSGSNWIVHCRDGEAVRPPHLGDACPECGLVSVTPDPDADDLAVGDTIRTSLA